MSERPKLATCFAPHLAMFTGALVAWVTMVLVKPSSLDLVSTIGRIQSVAFSLAFWSVFQAYARDLEMWGGGTISLTQDTKTRLLVIAYCMLAGVLLAAIVFVKGFYLVSALLTATLVVVMVSEIGWGSPWVLVTGKGRNEA